MPKPLWTQILETAKDEAVLAVDLYNRQRQARTLEAFFVHMHLAWQYLLHAEFQKAGVDYRYRDERGRLVRIDGEAKTWELHKCVSRRWSADEPVRRNLEATVSIRNRIEHRWQRELGVATAGFAQALVLNFESELCEYFGQRHSLDDALRFPLFVGAFTAEGVERMVAAQKALPASLRGFLASFHGDTDDAMVDDQRYEFRVHLIPRTGPRTESDISLTFVREEDLTDEQRHALTLLGRAGTVIVRERIRPIVNSGMLRPTQVARAVDGRVPFRFGLYSHFPQVWRHLGVRPPGGAEHPERTDERYCVYDSAHGDYLYTPAYIEKIVAMLSDEGTWIEVFGRVPEPKTVMGTARNHDIATGVSAPASSSSDGE